MAVLGLRFCARAFSSCGNWGHSSSRCAGLSLSRPVLLRSTGSRRAGSAIVAYGPSRSAACGIFPEGLEPVSPALAGRLSSTAPPGEPWVSDFCCILSCWNQVGISLEPLYESLSPFLVEDLVTSQNPLPTNTITLRG